MTYPIGHDEYFMGTHKEDINEGVIYAYCMEFYVPNYKCVCGYHKEHEGDACCMIEDEAHFDAWRKEFIHAHYVCQKANVPVISENAPDIMKIAINSRGILEVTYLPMFEGDTPEVVSYMRG